MYMNACLRVPSGLIVVLLTIYQCYQLISLFQSTPKLRVYDPADAVRRQKTNHPHACSCGVKSGDMFYSISNIFAFPVVDVQAQQMQRGHYQLYQQWARELGYRFACPFGVAPLLFNPFPKDWRKSESGCHSNNVSQEEEPEGHDGERLGRGGAEVLSICFVFGNTADSISDEGTHEVLQWDGYSWDNLGMIGQVVGRVCHRVDKVHPSELERDEELQRGLEHLEKPAFDTLLYGIFAVGILNDRAVQNGVGRRDKKGGDHACQNAFPLRLRFSLYLHDIINASHNLELHYLNQITYRYRKIHKKQSYFKNILSFAFFNSQSNIVLRYALSLIFTYLAYLKVSIIEFIFISHLLFIGINNLSILTEGASNFHLHIFKDIFKYFRQLSSPSFPHIYNKKGLFIDICEPNSIILSFNLNDK